MRTLNEIEINFLKDLKNVFHKYGIEIEVLIPEFIDQKQYIFEIIGKTEKDCRSWSYLLIKKTPENQKGGIQ